VSPGSDRCVNFSSWDTTTEIHRENKSKLLLPGRWKRGNDLLGRNDVITLLSKAPGVLTWKQFTCCHFYVHAPSLPECATAFRETFSLYNYLLCVCMHSVLG